MTITRDGYESNSTSGSSFHSDSFEACDDCYYVVTTRMISQLEGRQEQMKVLWSDLEVIGVWLQHVTRNGIRRMRENYDKGAHRLSFEDFVPPPPFDVLMTSIKFLKPDVARRQIVFRNWYWILEFIVKARAAVQQAAIILLRMSKRAIPEGPISCGKEKNVVEMAVKLRADLSTVMDKNMKPARQLLRQLLEALDSDLTHVNSATLKEYQEAPNEDKILILQTLFGQAMARDDKQLDQSVIERDVNEIQSLIRLPLHMELKGKLKDFEALFKELEKCLQVGWKA